MKKEDFIKGMTYLGMAFNKEYNKATIEMWYTFFEEVDYEIFRKAVKLAVERLSYSPAVKDLQEICKEVKKEKYMLLLNKLDSIGYFKDVNEKIKATGWIDRDIIPYWFLNDMKNIENELLLKNECELTDPTTETLKLKYSNDETELISDEELDELNKLFEEVRG